MKKEDIEMLEDAIESLRDRAKNNTEYFNVIVEELRKRIHNALYHSELSRDKEEIMETVEMIESQIDNNYQDVMSMLRSFQRSVERMVENPRDGSPVSSRDVMQINDEENDDRNEKNLHGRFVTLKRRLRFLEGKLELRKKNGELKIGDAEYETIMQLIRRLEDDIPKMSNECQTLQNGLFDKMMDFVQQANETLERSNEEMAQEDDEQEEKARQEQDEEEIDTVEQPIQESQKKPRTLQEILEYYKNNPPKTEAEARFVIQKLGEITDAKLEIVETLKKMAMLLRANAIIEGTIRQGALDEFDMVDVNTSNGGFSAYVMQRPEPETDNKGILYSAKAEHYRRKGIHGKTTVIQDNEGSVYQVTEDQIEVLVQYLKEHGLSVNDPEKEAKKREDRDPEARTPFE